jgi:GT2 family glycosyltransferase
LRGEGIGVASNAPDLTVVLTLFDHEGHAAECVESWARAQDLPRERYELVAVTNGREPEVDQLVGELLTSRDRLMKVPASQELELHDHGARAAAGRWLLFTEAHTVAEPDCLSSLLDHLSANEPVLAGACIRSYGGGSENQIARCEERWYADGFREWSRDGDWRKVTIRGFAILRDAYLDAGGFEHRFGCFAETALAANLAERGYRLGCAPEAAVKHYDQTRMAPLLRYVREYREGELAYRATRSAEFSERYFGVLPPRLDRRERLKAWLGYLRARARFHYPRLDDDERYARFLELWTKASDFEQQRALARNR